MPMDKTVFCLLAGALVGIGCKYSVCFLARRLLKNRGLDYVESQTMRLWLTVIMAAFGAAIGIFVPLSAETVFLFLLLVILGTLSVTDILHRRIPNDMLVALLAVTLALGIPGLFGVSGFHPFTVKGALIGLAAMFIVFTLPGLLKKNVGAGDIKLAACIGFSLGLSRSLLCVVVMGVLVLAFSLLQNRMPVLKFAKEMIPMGPFI